MVDIDICQRIQCGALSQSEAGPEVLLACSEAGHVGVKGCGNSACSPYLEDMRARGVCPPLVSDTGSPVANALLAPVARASVAASIPLLTAPLPSITPVRRSPVMDEYTQPWYCGINRWIDQHNALSVLVLAGAYLLLGGWRRRVQQ